MSASTSKSLVWRDEVESALPNNKFGTVLSVTAQTLTTIIGFGILALPNAISYLGWIAGPLLLFVFFCVTVISNYLLVSVYQINGQQHANYGTAVGSIMKSRRYATAITSVQLLNIVIVLIACTITGGSAIQQIARHVCLSHGKSEDEICDSQMCLGSCTGGVWQSILIFTGAEWVLCLFIKTLSGSRLISLVGMICTAFFVLVPMIIAFANIPEGGAAGTLDGVKTSTANKVFGIFNALGQMMSCYSIAEVLLEITDTLRQPPSAFKSMVKSTWITMPSCLVLYMLVGCSGYARYGNTVSDNVLNSFVNPQWALTLANTALLVNMLATYQILGQVLFERMETYIKARIARQSKMKRVCIEDGKDSTSVQDTMQSLDSVSQAGMDSGTEDGERVKDLHTETGLSGKDTQHVSVELPFWIRAIARSIPVLLMGILSSIMPFFGAFVGLIGTVSYWPLSIATPYIMVRKTFILNKTVDRALSVIFWVFLVVALVSLVGAVRSIVVGFSTYKIFGS